MSWLDTENDNLVTAALQAVQDAGLDSNRAVRLAIGLHEYNARRQDWSASHRMNEIALTAPAVDSDLMAQLLLKYVYGAACAGLGLFDEAVVSLRQSVELTGPAGRPEARAMIFASISRALGMAGRLDEGIGYGERAIASSRDTGNQLAEAYACLNLGQLYTNRGDRANELRLHQQGYAIFERLGDKLGMAHALLQTGLGHTKVGRAQDALTSLHDALEIYQDLGRPAEQASALKYIGSVHESLEEHGQALDALHEALSIMAHHPEWQTEAEIRCELGCVLAATGRNSEAREQLELALSAYQRHGSTAASEVRDRLDKLATSADAVVADRLRTVDGG